MKICFAPLPERMNAARWIHPDAVSIAVDTEVAEVDGGLSTEEEAWVLLLDIWR